MVYKVHTLHNVICEIGDSAGNFSPISVLIVRPKPLLLRGIIVFSLLMVHKTC